MSKTYPDLNLTNFPESEDSQRVYEDISINTYDDMQLYYRYINSKNFSAANQLLIDKPVLQRCIINALNLNAIEHKLIALQRFYLADFQKYIINAIKYKGSWLATETYSKFDVVTYFADGLTYLAVQKIVPQGIVPTNTSYYIPWSIKGEQGASGTGMSPRGAWDSQTQYYQYDIVGYDNKLWYASKNNTGSMPNLSSNDWSIAIDIMLYGSETETTSTIVQPDGKIIVNVKNQFAMIDF